MNAAPGRRAAVRLPLPKCPSVTSGKAQDGLQRASAARSAGKRNKSCTGFGERLTMAFPPSAVRERWR